MASFWVAKVDVSLEAFMSVQMAVEVACRAAVLVAVCWIEGMEFWVFAGWDGRVVVMAGSWVAGRVA